MLYRSVLLALVLAALPLATARAQSASGLPDHFMFGLEAGQGDTWLPQSGIPWDFTFQYLAGGVNTGQGWETWNPNGTFVLNYARDARQHGYIPMFPYYEILQSRGNCGNCEENRKDITNLNDGALMRAYYQNFALLMKRLGPGTYDGIQGFGGTAIINVEPDFAGGYAVQAVNNGACFGFCTGRGNDPALLEVAVGGSGFADVAGYADTYAGFTQALAHLRDVYAPNVLLGYEVSPWAAGVDIGLDSRANLDAAGMGQQPGVFLSKAGPHEVLFNDPLDRDAGQYRVQFGQNRWWDRLNVSFPNFARWEQYLHGAITTDNNKPMLLWQVPVGNQYFQSENNTDGHFQDNRAEYIFNHIPELIQTGIVGALFGPGNAGNTSYGDSKKDGITNPAAICTSDGISSGQICNDHPSSVADDDGGYLRMMGQAYYQAPVGSSGSAPAAPLPAASAPPVAPDTAAAAPTPAPDAAAPGPRAPLSVSLGAAGADPSDASNGQDITVFQDVMPAADAALLVDFEIYDSQGRKVWQTWHDNLPFQGGAMTTDFAVYTIPGDLAPGRYTFKTGVFSTGWGTLYAWNDNAGTLTVQD
ncbi:MAG TPA: hypothetical protein VK898_06985 [Chloroflexota bacterium]|nr:hypothetical protein [Chloroflexota bacterium]